MKDNTSYVILTVHLPGRDITFLIYRPYDWEIFVDLLKEKMALTINSSGFDELAPLIEGVVCWHIPDDVLGKLTNLKWIQTTSSGVDHLYTYLKTKKDSIIVSTIKGINASTVAEFVLLSILAHKWNLPLLLKQQENRVWQAQATNASNRCVCAVIGVGEIGRRVAKQMKGLGMRILGVRASAVRQRYVDEMYGLDELEIVLAQADFVVLSVPLTSQTENLIGSKELGVMKLTSYLINVSRGNVIDESALISALYKRRIAGASLDVTQIEPCPVDSPLWDTPNLILSPHIAGQLADYSQQAASVWIKNIYRYAAGERPEPVFDFI